MDHVSSLLQSELLDPSTITAGSASLSRVQIHPSSHTMCTSRAPFAVCLVVMRYFVRLLGLVPEGLTTQPGAFSSPCLQVLDTPGLEVGAGRTVTIPERARELTGTLLSGSDAALLVVDGQHGTHPLDAEIGECCARASNMR